MGVSDCIAIVDVLFTTILTGIIIFQTSALSKRQHMFEEATAKKESELQQRQLQVETYPFKREIYANTFAIFECCRLLKNLSQKIDLTNKTGEQLSVIVSSICKVYIPDLKATLWNLRESEYVLPDNISKSLLDIRTRFDLLYSNLHGLGALESLMTEIELQTVFIETKKGNIATALNECDKILSYRDFIESILPKELNIANINKEV